MTKIPFLERLHHRPLVFDGAMGTMMYARGIFINRCFDEICLTNPDIVCDIHRQYIEAGADVIETNTFGANRIRLRGHGLGDMTREINLAGARLARECIGDNGYVAGSAGPVLTPGQLLTDTNRTPIAEAFEESITALAEGGVDVILLETFCNVDELLLAAEAAARTGLPVAASFTVDIQGETARGRRVEDVVAALSVCPCNRTCWAVTPRDWQIF